jgi:hypothetical protein
MPGSKKKKRAKRYSSTPCPPSSVGAEVLAQLTKHDVCLGRGTVIIKLKGNAHFRQVISAHRSEYRSYKCSIIKRAVAVKVVEMIESLDPPGRFYEILPNATLHSVSFERALDKTMQALREKRGTATLPPPLSSNQQDNSSATLSVVDRSAKSTPVKKTPRLVKRINIRIHKVAKEVRSCPATLPPDQMTHSIQLESVDGSGIPAKRAEGNNKTSDEASDVDDHACMIDKTARAVAQGGKLQQLVESVVAIAEENPLTLDEKFALVPPPLTVFVSGLYSSNNLDHIGSNSFDHGPYSPFRGHPSKEAVNQKMTGQHDHLGSMNVELGCDMELVDLVELSCHHTNYTVVGSSPWLPDEQIQSFAKQQPTAAKLGIDALPFVHPPLLQEKNSLFLDDDHFNQCCYPPALNREAESIEFRPLSGSHSAYHPSIGTTPSAFAQINKQTNLRAALLSPDTVMDVVEPPQFDRVNHSLFLDEQKDDHQDSYSDVSIAMSIFEDTFSMDSLDGIL